MSFFKSFQLNLPPVDLSSLLDQVSSTVSSRVDELANAVSDVKYTVSDQFSAEQQGGGGGEGSQGSADQDGKATRRGGKRQSEADGVGQSGDGGAEAGGTAAQGQLEWEWRDGCWRVKKTEAELEEEEKKKKAELEWEEKRESRRRERKGKQLEREARSAEEETTRSQEHGVQEDRGKKEEEEEEEEEESRSAPKGGDGKPVGGGEKDDGSCGGEAPDRDEPLQSSSPKLEKGGSKKKKKKKTKTGEKEQQEEEAKEKPDGEQQRQEEEMPLKRKKSDKKKSKAAKEEAKKAEKAEKAAEKEKKKEEKKKSKKKKKKGAKEGGCSDSEEERGAEAQQNSASVWDNREKRADQEGYSSEASNPKGKSIQRIRRESPLNELQPPPYQDEDTRAVSAPRVRSGRRARRTSSQEGSRHGSSEASLEQDTESYLNKGYDEDVPSDSTAVLGPEDGSAPHFPSAYEPEPLAKYGTLDVAFEYDSGEQWLAVTVTAATDIPALKQTGNISWQVHLVLLPTKKQRAKTGVQKGPCPVFTETFKFSRVEQEALTEYAVRFRLYSVRRMKKEKVLGEKVFYLTKLNLQGKMALPVTLEPGTELTGCGSLVSVSRSAGALSYRSTGESATPEILLGLIYNSATGRLSAEVVQGSHFKNTASDKPTNTYVKLTMLDSKGKEMSKCKTAVCRGQPNPSYKETFVFQVALFQLSEVSLVVSVFSRRSSMKPREKLGWVSLGLDSSGEDQQAHWSQMKEAEGQQVCHWHTLTDS